MDDGREEIDPGEIDFPPKKGKVNREDDEFSDEVDEASVADLESEEDESLEKLQDIEDEEEEGFGDDEDSDF